jgi:5-methylcytosine-specific restriction endonuclease McrA
MAKLHPTDKYLMSLWRKAVFIHNGRSCFFCGNRDFSQIECDHIVPRRNTILRWDYRNGIPACCIDQGIYGGKTCHQYAETLKGMKEIEERHPHWDYLKRCELIDFKQYLLEEGLTSQEFRKIMLAKLKIILNGEY